MSRITTSLAVVAALCSNNLALAQTVALHYNNRPPYQVLQEGNLTGLTGSPAIAAFKGSGVPFSLAETPATRQLETLKRNNGFDCGIGWFKNPEREEFAKFTKPIYQDESQVALTLAGSSKLKTGDAIESVLANKDLTLLVKQSYSYGKALDAMIDNIQPKRQSVTVENILMFKMIEGKRADYMFVAPEEAAVTIAAAGFQREQFNLVKLGNMPKGELRYIMCSKNVPDEILNKLNAAIKG